MCPYINRNDPRCATHWTLHELGQAYEHCADRYQECPVYLRMAGRPPSDVLAQVSFPLLAAS